ncbi:hypothetical protein [Xylanibacter ruminicola]|uniref:hypothetical protein n=1 Tax=Xylanibacter ruminicola TaxID=839 RepID=UPI0004908A7F|nr:hypothetical protein [Xylanibacter ruminicola]
MAIQVDREKWILYKHTNSYEMIKAVALDVKNQCGTNVSEIERHRMQQRLAALNFYKARNPKMKLDSINHRINTLEFFMFGYESNLNDSKRFIFSPLGNLFLNYIEDEEKLRKIFTTMLFAIQFQHYANGTPANFQLYPFRLIFKLLLDPRLNGKLYFAEYAYCIAEIQNIDQSNYENLVKEIIKFRSFPKEKIRELMKEDEHYYVTCVYEWQYYITNLLEEAQIFSRTEGNEICRLYHPQKPNSKSAPTGRKLNDGFVSIADGLATFIAKLLNTYSCFAAPLALDDPERMTMDIVKEIYSFYPNILTSEIGEEDELQQQLLRLPQMIEEYANNEEGETAYLFEDILKEGFDMFYDVEAHKIGGAGHTDIECLYFTRKKTFAVEAKSTKNKLGIINAGRLKAHREEIGASYTIVITPRYVPAVKKDIKGQNIVILLANTFSEYLYNHIYHDIREILYEDFDDIIINHLGEDISKYISDKTIEKFSAHS